MERDIELTCEDAFRCNVTPTHPQVAIVPPPEVVGSTAGTIRTERAGYNTKIEKVMLSDAFGKQLKKSRQIKISVIGRKTGKTITRPVWFVVDENSVWLLPVNGSKTQWFRNLLKNPVITIKVGTERRELTARTVRSATAVRKVLRAFGDKYKPEVITRLYPGPLDVAVQVKL